MNVRVAYAIAIVLDLRGKRSSDIAAKADRELIMRRFPVAAALTAGIALFACRGLAESTPPADAYRILKTATVGGEGDYDYIFADVESRRLYTPRSGAKGHLAVFNLDTLDRVGDIAGIDAGGATVDPKSHHGFSTTTPITMWDSNTLKVIKRIDVGADPDGITIDPYNERVWVLNHARTATVIDAKEGVVVGTLDLGGRPEQAVSDGRGTIYVNISDKATIAVVDAKSLTVKARYDVSSKGSGGTGLALDVMNHILFAYVRLPSPTVVIMNADNGNIITTLPTGTGTVDTVAFNPATMEAISADNRGSMTFIKENSPTSFTREQTVHTLLGARTLALDAKTNHVFTMAPKFAPTPANAPTSPLGHLVHGPEVPGSFTILMVGK